MKEVVAHLTAAEWQTLITATIGSVFAGLIGLINAWQNKKIAGKIEQHEIKSEARSRTLLDRTEDQSK